jgi:hypothetical protein
LLVSGAVVVCVGAWWHHQGTGMTGHVVRDLPAALGFAAVVAAVAAHPPTVLVSAASSRRSLWTAAFVLWVSRPSASTTRLCVGK